jgi:transcriptional regulator with XRE-family HTH domain
MSDKMDAVDWREMLALSDAGTTQAEIARMVGSDQGTVSRRLAKQRGGPARRPMLTEEQWAAFEAEYRAGQKRNVKVSIKSLAERYGVSESWASKKLRHRNGESWAEMDAHWARRTQR